MGATYSGCPLNFKEVYILKGKFVVLSAFLSVLLLFSSFSVKANDVVFPAFPEPVEGQSSTHYLIFRDNETGSYFLVKPLVPGLGEYDRNVEVNYYPSELAYQIYFNTPTIIYTWREGERVWETYREIAIWGNFNLPKGKVQNGTIEFLYYSFDLYYSEYYESGSLFFQKAPIKANFLTQMKQVEMGATLTTLVSLVPLLMALVASFLAFRKALAWLLKVLRKA